MYINLYIVNLRYTYIHTYIGNRVYLYDWQVEY